MKNSKILAFFKTNIVHFIQKASIEIKNIYRSSKQLVNSCDRELTEFVLLYSSANCILCNSDIKNNKILESKKLLHEFCHVQNTLFLKHSHIMEYYFCPECVRKLLFSLSKVVRCTFCSGFYQIENKDLSENRHKKLSLIICREKHDMPFVVNYSLLPFFDFFHDIYIKAKYNNQIQYLWLLFSIGINISTYPIVHHMSKIIDIIIPVPMSLRKKFSRNYNVSDLLAKCLSKIMGKKVLFLLKEKGKSYQHLKRKFDAADRYSLKQKYKRKCLLCHKTVLLVDDIYTTGSTMKTCAQICKDAGAEKIYAITLFRTIYSSTKV